MASKNLSSWEERCLSQLDDESIWKSLKRDQPEQDEDLPRPVSQMIFRFNFMIFAVAIGVVLFGGAMVTGSSISEIFVFPDFGFGIAFVLIASAAFSLYTAGIYKRAWNRRAESLRNEG